MARKMIRVGMAATQNGAGLFNRPVNLYIRPEDRQAKSARGLEDALRLILRHQAARWEDNDGRDALRDDRHQGPEDRAV